MKLKLVSVKVDKLDFKVFQIYVLRLRKRLSDQSDIMKIDLEDKDEGDADSADEEFGERFQIQQERTTFHRGESLIEINDIDRMYLN